MKEEWLHEVWQRQPFTHKPLKTVSGQAIHIVGVGTPNSKAGPDFLGAKIIIGSNAFYGDVEIHTKASDWYAHHHQLDPRYNSVTLHVVWEANSSVIRADGTSLPTIALKDYLDPRFQEGGPLCQESLPRPCAYPFVHVPRSVLERTVVERLTEKSRFIKALFRKNHDDTEATIYHLLGYNFGFNANSTNFLKLVKKVPLPLLHRYRANLLYLEALLLGQAGLLPTKGSSGEGYAKELLDIYHYLQVKHQLSPMRDRRCWQFSGLRPANFPTLRIAQFARLIHVYPELFSLLVNTPFKELRRQLSVKQSSYWQTHYLWGKRSPTKIGQLGKRSVENIMINSVVPLLFTYGKLREDDFFIDKGIDMLERLPAEDNTIVRKWGEAGFTPRNAWESQALIGLFKASVPMQKG